MPATAPWETDDSGTASKKVAAPKLAAAPWETNEKTLTVGEDLSDPKKAASSAYKGFVGTITTPRAISDLTGAGVNYLANKFAPQSVADAANKFHNWDTGVGEAFPSYDQIIKETEEDPKFPVFHGKLPEYKTGVGKAVGTGVELVPGLAAGGEVVLPTVGRALAGGTLSGLMGSGVDWLHEKLPNVVPDWAPGVARAAGGAIGSGIAPRIATPLPMTDARLAETNALAATNPELRQASSAGQWTGSPRFQAVEARSPRAADVPQAQAEAYTRGVMRQAGADGQLWDAAGRGQASNVGDMLDILRNQHAVNPVEKRLLENQNRREYINLSNVVGRRDAAPMLNLNEDIRIGPSRGTPGYPTSLNHPRHPTTIPGQRVGALAQKAQAAGTGTTPSLVGNRIFDTRTRLLDALYNSMPVPEANRLRELNQQYSNWKTIEGIPEEVGENTLTPQQVGSRARDGSDLHTHATQAENVMTPFPKPTNEPSEGLKALSTLLGGLGGAVAGHHTGGSAGAVAEGTVGAIAGEKLPHFVNVAKNAAGRVAMNPTIQAWAKNQHWRPNVSITGAPNMEALVRALSAQHGDVGR